MAWPQTVAHVLVIRLHSDCQLFPTGSLKVSAASQFDLVSLCVIEEVILHTQLSPDLDTAQLYGGQEYSVKENRWN